MRSLGLMEYKYIIVYNCIQDTLSSCAALGGGDERTKDARTANSGKSLDGRTEPLLLEYLIYDCYFLSKHENCS